MSHETFTLDELARHLGLDKRQLEKLAQRGRLPGRKVSGEWQFHQAEITGWLEQEMREYTDAELQAVEEAQASPTVAADLPVTSLMPPELVQVPLDARTRRSAIESLIEVAGRTWQIWEPASVAKAVLERENQFPTTFPGGVAIPHPRNPLPDVLGESVLAFGRTHSGIPFGSPTGELTDLFFLLICQDSRTHLQVLARLARMLQLPGFLHELRECPDSQTSYHLIRRTDETLSV